MNNIPIDFNTPNTQLNNVSIDNINSFIESDFAKNLQLTYGLEAGVFNSIIADLFKYLSIENSNAAKYSDSEVIDLFKQFNVGEDNLMNLDKLQSIKELIEKKIVQYIAMFNYRANNYTGFNSLGAFNLDNFVSEINKNLTSELFYKDSSVNNLSLKTNTPLTYTCIPAYSSVNNLSLKNDVLRGAKIENLLLENSAKDIELNKKNIANRFIMSSDESINNSQYKKYDLNTSMDKILQNYDRIPSTIDDINGGINNSQYKKYDLNTSMDKILQNYDRIPSTIDDINGGINNIKNSVSISMQNGNSSSNQNAFLNVNEFLKMEGLRIADSNNNSIDMNLSSESKVMDNMKSDYVYSLGNIIYDNSDISSKINLTDSMISSSGKVIDNITNIINSSVGKLLSGNQSEVNLKIHLTSSDVVSVDVKLHNNTINVNIDTNSSNIGQFISSNVDILKNNLHTNNFSLGTVSVNVSGGFTNMNDDYKKNKQIENNEYIYVAHKKNNDMRVPKVRNLEVVV